MQNSDYNVLTENIIVNQAAGAIIIVDAASDCNIINNNYIFPTTISDAGTNTTTTPNYIFCVP